MSNTEGLSECCLTGHLHKGTPKGQEKEIYGLSTYISGDNAAQTIVLLTDIWGPSLENARLVADEFAAQGFRVLAPDVTKGDWIPRDLLKAIAPQQSDPEPSVVEKATNTAKVGANLGPWLVRNREANAKPVIDEYVKQVRADPAVKKVGAIGFCWGGRYAILLGHQGHEPHVDAVVAQHPSFVSLPGEIEKLDAPTQINVGDVDAMMPVDQVKQAKEILDKSSTPSEVNIISGAAHGFAVRGDQNEDKEVKQKDEATKNAVNWFLKYLGV